MTIKDLFRVLLKLFGLYVVITTLFSSIPSSIFFFSGREAEGVVWTIVVLAVMFILFLLFIFNTNWIIDKLELGKGFDNDTINFQNFSNVTVIHIGCFVIGGLLFIENLPFVLTRGYYLVEVFASDASEAELSEFRSTRDYIYFYTNLFQIIVGVFLFTNPDKIAALFREKKESDG